LSGTKTWRNEGTDLPGFGGHVGCRVLEIIPAAEQDLPRSDTFAFGQALNESGKLDGLALAGVDGDLMRLFGSDGHGERRVVMTEQRQALSI
jgi:hypothetical protein